MKTDKLKKTFVKTFTENGLDYEITAYVRLSCESKHNRSCDFAVTGDVYCVHANGRKEFERGGCIHEVIVKHFPELKPFVDLHLHDSHGVPAIGEFDNLTEYERGKLLNAREDDMRYYKYLLRKMGILDKCEYQAKCAIRMLEDMTGDTWVNPFDGNEYMPFSITDEESNEIEELIGNGHFTDEAMFKRSEERRKSALDEELKFLEETWDKEVKEIEDKRRIYTYIHNKGLSLENVIYYPHDKRVVFNWRSYGNRISNEEFSRFTESVDYSELPDGIKFVFGEDL